MKYEESVANINKDGKQSVCLRLHPIAQKFLELIQEEFDNPVTPEFGRKSIFPDTSDYPRPIQLICDALLIVDGQCCECDYMITSDEDEKHDFEAFKKTIKDHGGYNDVSKDEWKQLWNRIKPLIAKEMITWKP